MSKLKITGGVPLKGEVVLQASKNAVLPLLAAGVLSQGSVTFTEVPDISDVHNMLCVLRSMGARTEFSGKALTVDYSDISPAVCTESCGKLRASVFLLGPLVGRFGSACLPYPGGCSIGQRPLDVHAQGFRALGCSFSEGEQLTVSVNRLTAGNIYLRMPSVGATVNLLCAAVKTPGETVITNCAREPEICDLARFLRKMGAKIKGEGTRQLVVQGVKSLHGASFSPQKDRIEGGTFLAAIAATGGEGVILGGKSIYFSSVLKIFAKTACKIRCENDKIYLKADSPLYKGVSITTGPYPAFPTDMQSVILPYLTRCSGESRVTETLFENRFSCARELLRMGADITVNGNMATVRPSRLFGARVTAGDLRAAAGLAVGALMAEGESEVCGVEHLLRGYENFAEKLRAIGADARITD